jgi:hypothetical protein
MKYSKNILKACEKHIKKKKKRSVSPSRSKVFLKRVGGGEWGNPRKLSGKNILG